MRDSEHTKLLFASTSSESKSINLSDDQNIIDGEPIITEAAPYEAEDSKHKATLVGAYANLTTGIIGVGILSFPYAFLQAGVYVNLAFTLIFALVNIWSINLMSFFAERLMQTKKLNYATYEGVILRTLGTHAYYLVTICILFTVLGTLTAFLIVTADMAQPVLEKWVDVGGGFGDFLTSRLFVVLFFAVFFAFPLALLGNMHHLSFTSIIAIGSVFMVAGVVIYRGCEALADNARDLTNHISLAQGSLRIILALPLCVFALGCQLQVVPVYAELNKQRRRDFTIVVWLSVFSCAVMYIIVGLFGYIEFGPDTKGDILTNYSLSDIPVDIAKLLMGFHIILAYPIALFPGRKCFDMIILRLVPRLASIPNLVRVVLESIVIITITGLFAVLLPQVQIVFGLIGSTVSVALGMFFPAAMLWSFEETEHLESRDHEEKGSEGRCTPTLGASRYFTSNRIKAALLFLLGVFLVIAGTGVSIYQDFF